MKTAVIYARYSSDNQTEQSIEGQLRVCEEYAQKNNILILGTYIDRAMTGTNDNRPDFQRMIKDSNRREWNFVLVYKLDRFSRNKYEAAIHKKTLRDNGVKVLSAMENIPDTPEGIILESLLEGMNQYFSAELAQKVKRGMRETRLKGLYQGGWLPYGYKVIDRKIVADESCVETVRYIFSQYSVGVCVREIIDGLNKKGLLCKGKPFAMNTVYGILRNEKYTGIYRIGEDVLENMYPKMIDTDLFESVKAKLEKNKYGKNSIEVPYLLRRKIKCGYCGKSMIGECGTARNGETKRYYKCTGKKHFNGCQKMQIRKEELEECVINAIIEQLSSPDVMNKIVNKLVQLQDTEETVSSALTMLLNEKHGVERSLANLVNAIENGIISNTTNNRLQELEKRQEELERQILMERSKRTVKMTESEIRRFYEQALKAEPKILINLLVKEIVLYDDKIEIYYNNPTNKSPDGSRGFLLYVGKSKIISEIQNKSPKIVIVTIEMYLR